MYGFGMAFFYSLSGLASHPTTAITIGYLMNLLGLMVPLYFVSRILYQDRENSTLDSISFALVSAFSFILPETRKNNLWDSQYSCGHACIIIHLDRVLLLSTLRI